MNALSTGREYIYCIHFDRATYSSCRPLAPLFSFPTTVKIMSDATDNPRKDDSNLNDFKHTSPIPILASPHHRRRSSTVSSDEAPTTPPDIQTSTSFPTINPAPASPTSPIFSYFMSSPPKTASFPYRRIPGFGAPAVFEGVCMLGFWW